MLSYRRCPLNQHTTGLFPDSHYLQTCTYWKLRCLHLYEPGAYFSQSYFGTNSHRMLHLHHLQCWKLSIITSMSIVNKFASCKRYRMTIIWFKVGDTSIFIRLLCVCILCKDAINYTQGLANANTTDTAHAKVFKCNSFDCYFTRWNCCSKLVLTSNDSAIVFQVTTLTTLYSQAVATVSIIEINPRPFICQIWCFRCIKYCT